MSRRARSTSGSPPARDDRGGGAKPLGTATVRRTTLFAVQRLTRVLLAVVAGTSLTVLLLLLPVLPFTIPLELRLFIRQPLWRILAIALVLVFGPSVLPEPFRRRGWNWLIEGMSRIGSSRPIAAAWVLARRASEAVRSRLGALISRLDGFAAWALGGPLLVIAASDAALLLLTWIPHYLTWPWWPDVDQFAVSAQSWSAGIVPYRDQLDFDFPAPIYLHFLLGKVFGWGGTVAFHAVDAGLVVFLGVALVLWSRRLYGSALPAVVGYVAFLLMYLDLDFSIVAERDWHGPLFVVLGLLALDVWPGHTGRILAALGMAVGLAFRPQEVVFLPAMAAAVEAGARRGGEPWRAAVRPLLEWSAWLALSLVVSFSPLILAGTFDDLIRAVCSAHQGPYDLQTWYSFTEGLREYFRSAGTMAVLAGSVFMALAGPWALRRIARTWGLALLGAFLYKPMSPWPHPYLDQPIALVWSVTLAVLVGGLLNARLAPLARFAAVVAVMALCLPGVPRFCTATGSLAAVGPLVRGEDPPEQPPGCDKQFSSPRWPSERYRWEDYRSVLAYLRRSTPQGVPVADLLWNVPFPPVNGPTGHLTPFPAAGGYIYLWMVDPSLVDRYVKILERETATLVVWSPGKPNPFFPDLDRIVRVSYRPVARFGDIEVWRHRRVEQPAARPTSTPHDPH